MAQAKPILSATKMLAQRLDRVMIQGDIRGSPQMKTLNKDTRLGRLSTQYSAVYAKRCELSLQQFTKSSKPIRTSIEPPSEYSQNVLPVQAVASPK